MYKFPCGATLAVRNPVRQHGSTQSTGVRVEAFIYMYFKTLSSSASSLLLSSRYGQLCYKHNTAKNKKNKNQNEQKIFSNDQKKLSGH